jgi:hypothetical protein
VIPALLLASALDLHLDYTRQSLTATYRHYTRADGAEVIDRVDPDGTAHRLHVGPPARPTRRVIVRERPHEPVAVDIDVVTGEVVRRIPLFFNAKGRVFEVNPVAKLNAPQLRDQNDAASAVPETAYSIVDLPDLVTSGPLEGPNVKIIDLQEPHPQRPDASQSLLFDRGQPQFEEVNAYYAIDRSQRYLQSLGYTGTRRIVGYALPVDPHAFGGQDNSVYETSTVPGQGVLFFGDGGTDDAEDPDIVLHEYTHAIQDWIAPGAFFGSSASEARALAEGIADYWGFSQNYVQTVASGRDPYCLGDWDARCDGDDPSQQCGYPPGADCLRRLDSTKTFADFRAVEHPGQEHENGAIWSSALREIFDALLRRHPEDGRRLSDRIVIESMFGIPSSPTYAILAANMVHAADALSPADRDVVCGAMTGRGIPVPDCIPRGELTLFQSSTSRLQITDPRAIERIALQVDATGAFVLIAPDGTTVTDFASLRGRSAAGTWTLQVTGGTLRSWTLAIQFAGDARLPGRPVTSLARRHIAAAAHAGGENGTLWITDVRILNRGDKPANVTAIYTPDAGDFAAVKLVVRPQQVIALNDIVGTTMQSAGTLGSLEFQGDVVDLVITSRTYTGTYGQFVAGVSTTEAIGAGEHAVVAHLSSDADFRSNAGFTEVAGQSGVVRVGTKEIPVAPFQHVQMPVGGPTDFAVVSGDARILAYGSMIDNRSGDAIYVPAQVPPATSRGLLVPAISAPGALGTQWSTEVVITGSGRATAAFDGVVLNFTPPLRSANFLRDVLHVDNTFGMLTLAAPPGSLATARIWTSSSAGTYGQFVPFLSIADARGGDLIQLEVSPDFRTNIGVAAPPRARVEAIGARITTYDAEGTVLRVEVRSLFPLELSQVPLPVNAARVRVDGGVFAYASVIDNRSGDAIFVPAQ